MRNESYLDELRRAAEKVNPVPPEARLYVYGHPIAVMISIGLFFSGLAGLLGIWIPGLTGESSVALALPEAVYALFNLVCMVGGATAAGGLISGRRDVEAAGMMLLAAALLAYFVTIVAVRPTSAIQIQFILWLGLGCLLRVRYLTHPPKGEVL